MTEDKTQDPNNIQSHDPAERDWEYDGDGSKIYKPGVFGKKTPWDGGWAGTQRKILEFFKGRAF